MRLANNDLQALPDEVLRAPSLAWVALAGNPRLVGFGQLASALETTMARIDFSDAVALGKGASGSVRSASYRGTPCAVKELLETSSDGAARDELAVHERVAGETPSTLIKTLAIIRNRRPSSWSASRRMRGSLAGPPTIIEVTRDRYEDGERFSSAFSIDTCEGPRGGAAVPAFQARGARRRLRPQHARIGFDGRGEARGFWRVVLLRRARAVGAKIDRRVEVRAFGVLCAEVATRIVGAAAIQQRRLAVADDASRATRRRGRRSRRGGAGSM